MIKIIGRKTGLGNQIHAIPFILGWQNLGFRVVSDSTVYNDLGLKIEVREDYEKYNFILYGYDWRKTLREVLKFKFAKLIGFAPDDGELIGFDCRIKGNHYPVGLDRSLIFDNTIHEFDNLKRLFDMEADYIWPGQRRLTQDTVAVMISKKEEKTLSEWTIKKLCSLLMDEEFSVVQLDKGGIDTPTLGDLKKELSKCRYAIASDSGAMHLADVMGIKVLALFGPTSEIKNGPINGISLSNVIECRPCYDHGRVKCKWDWKYGCMDFTAKRIFDLFIEEM
jgi:hypothetical protein